MSMLLRIYPGDAWCLLGANVLVQVTVVILSAWLLARLGNRWNAAVRHGIYSLALICVLASPMLSLLMPTTGIALVKLRPSVTITAPIAAATAEPVSIPMVHAPESSPIKALAPPPAAENLGQGLENPSALPFSDVLRALAAAALVIWLLGAAVFLARWCRGLRLIAALRRTAKPLDHAALAESLPQVHLALRTNRLPPIAVSADLDRPVMVGLIRPLVILPQHVLRTLHGHDLADILVHECAHAVCRHHVVGFLQRVAGMIFWPHPLVHLLNRELARAREEVCDNYVLRHGDAPRYARTLLELSQTLKNVSPKPAALGLFFHCPWRLEDRVADLLDRRRRAMTRVNRLTAAALTATFLSLTLLIAGTTIVQAEPAADGAKLAADGAKLAADGAKLVADGEKLVADGAKLVADGAKLVATKTTKKKTATPPVKKSKSQPPSPLAAEKVERRAVNKLVRDFPEKIDLSTPESAMAAWSRSVARKDFQAALDLSWVKLDAEAAKAAEQGLKYASDVTKNFDQLLLDSEIIEVLTCHDDLAAVIFKSSLIGKRSYCPQHFGRINGKWMNLDWLNGERGFSPSVEAARERFEKNKDALWQNFVKVRNDVKNGRVPVFERNKVQLSLSAAEKKDIKRWQSETWQIILDLNMPSLIPQAVQFAILYQSQLRTARC